MKFYRKIYCFNLVFKEKYEICDFFYNHRKYIEKAIKPIAKVIYKDKTKKKKIWRNRGREYRKNNKKTSIGMLQQKQKDRSKTSKTKKD
jgi:hypothetical protein